MSLVTKNEGDTFLLSITQESDVSIDGGYSFESVTSSYCLGKKEALLLAIELLVFCKQAAQPHVQATADLASVKVDESK